MSFHHSLNRGFGSNNSEIAKRSSIFDKSENSRQRRSSTNTTTTSSASALRQEGGGVNSHEKHRIDGKGERNHTSRKSSASDGKTAFGDRSGKNASDKRASLSDSVAGATKEGGLIDARKDTKETGDVAKSQDNHFLTSGKNPHREKEKLVGNLGEKLGDNERKTPPNDHMSNTKGSTFSAVSFPTTKTNHKPTFISEEKPQQKPLLSRFEDQPEERFDEIIKANNEIKKEDVENPVEKVVPGPIKPSLNQSNKDSEEIHGQGSGVNLDSPTNLANSGLKEPKDNLINTIEEGKVEADRNTLGGNDDQVITSEATVKPTSDAKLSVPEREHETKETSVTNFGDKGESIIDTNEKKDSGSEIINDSELHNGLPVDKGQGIKKKQDPPSSPAQNFADSSYLSPVGTEASDDDFFLTRLSHASKGEDKKESDDEEKSSEAETDIASTPPRMRVPKKLIRKKEFDQNRRNLIKNGHTLDSSDDENERSLSVNESKSSMSPIGRRDSNKRPYKIKRDSNGRSLLQRACKKGNLDDVKRYIERGASPNEHDFCGFTCLHEAALEGHTDIVKFLIGEGADVNKQAFEEGDLETPLIDAAENKHLETVKALLENGADPRIFNIDGFTALSKLYNEHNEEEGYEEITKLLEQYSAKFAEKADKTQSFTKAASEDSRITSPDPSSIVEDPNDIYFGDLVKKKSHAAIIYRHAAEGLKELTANYFVEGGRLDYKPDILFLAARNGHVELVDIILGLSPDFDINTENTCGTTALLSSVGRKHTKVIEFLLSKGANPLKRRKQDNLNALQIAERAFYFDPEEVRLLKEYVRKFKDDFLSSDKETNETFKSKEGTPLSLGSPRHHQAKRQKLFTKEYNSTGDGNARDEKRHKKVKTKEFDPKVKTQISSVFSKDNTPDSQDELKSFKSTERSDSPHIEGRQEKPTVKLESDTSSMSPAPSSKAQEEEKAKTAEEARIWQQKVEAKKRARKDMFLKSEKERERKRQEEYQRRIEEERKLQLQKQIENKRQKELEEQRTKELTRKFNELEQKYVFQSYPLGVKYALLDNRKIDAKIRTYSPLYVFSIYGSKYVLDLQLALLTGEPTQNFIQSVPSKSVITLDSPLKSKIWKVFLPMIGTDKVLPSHHTKPSLDEDHKSFQKLFLNFLLWDDIVPYISQNHPKVSDFITKTATISYVDLQAISPVDNRLTRNKVSQVDVVVQPENKEPPIDAKQQLFPKFHNRKDVVNTIRLSSTFLW